MLMNSCMQSKPRIFSYGTCPSRLVPCLRGIEASTLCDHTASPPSPDAEDISPAGPGVRASSSAAAGGRKEGRKELAAPAPPRQEKTMEGEPEPSVRPPADPPTHPPIRRLGWRGGKGGGETARIPLHRRFLLLLLLHHQQSKAGLPPLGRRRSPHASALIRPVAGAGGLMMMSWEGCGICGAAGLQSGMR
ncbi:uncharacterized protein K452DRAFT_44849 [Aplosporella prunicola CBS 121167]|uniref:Uncharacterized protein n=1 Tax=Aplosporella prunicola CBS 121167 TaxID=1176127 RepID=A0A6A6BBT2_9PEZI|nr:uncharacterized protein K452DRAFT_44849 [Aplosporella prunicola CBS 121167]KAF2141068.1 hypothetical protein K452DRAFT_44849 [Aplosporella prunicola CBS 121167]